MKFSKSYYDYDLNLNLTDEGEVMLLMEADDGGVYAFVLDDSECQGLANYLCTKKNITGFVVKET